MLACCAVGCASVAPLNYGDVEGPRHAGNARTPFLAVAEATDFLVASFNVKFAEEPDNALRTLRKGGLDRADVLLLQEMDAPATAHIAAQLGMEYVYYPATIHPASGRPFGVAILSRWPIRDDHKIVLPDFADSRDPAAKVAAAAVIWVRGVPVGVVNVHLQLGLSATQTREQLRTAADCAFSVACAHPAAPLLPPLRHVVVAGDFNTSNQDKMDAADAVLGDALLRRVPGIGRTYKYLFLGLGKLDHVYASASLEPIDAGQVRGFLATGSDHYPVYARLRFVGDVPAPWIGFAPDTQRAGR